MMIEIERLGRARQALRQALALVREAGQLVDQVADAPDITHVAHGIADAMESVDVALSRAVRVMEGLG